MSKIMIFISSLILTLCLDGCNRNSNSIDIIGGADGPTAVYISSIVFKPLPFTMTIIAAVVSIVGIYKTRR